MTRLVGVTSLAGGALLVVVPRYVLPACEWRGFPAMRCSDTARAVMIAGALLAATGLVTLVARKARVTLAAGVLALGASVAAFVLPERVGYCHSARMPCTYGMVPSVRLVAVACGLVALAALVSMARRAGRKEAA